MKKSAILFVGIVLSMTLLAGYASAHERDTYKIGDKEYTFVVGFLGEPAVVDDKSGVDFHLTQMGGAPSTGMGMGVSSDETVTGTPVTGAEKTLKVEISAGGKKKVLSFEPAWNQKGVYHALFFPTVQTTYTYTITGMLNGVKISVPFTCVAGEVSESSEDNTVVKLSDGVVREKKIGGFGCPESKADYGFPEASVSSYNLQSNLADIGNRADTSRSLGMAGIGAGILGVIVAVVAVARNKKT